MRACNIINTDLFEVYIKLPSDIKNAESLLDWIDAKYPLNGKARKETRNKLTRIFIRTVCRSLKICFYKEGSVLKKKCFVVITAFYYFIIVDWK